MNGLTQQEALSLRMYKSAPKTYGDIIGRTYNTPFGFKGKVYTTNDKTSFDVYVR